jgi:hypothetical protein
MSVISEDWDRWSLVILVLLALLVGFFLVKAIAGLSLFMGVLLIICLGAIVIIPGLPSGVRIGFALTGLIVGAILAIL